MKPLFSQHVANACLTVKDGLLFKKTTVTADPKITFLFVLLHKCYHYVICHVKPADAHT